ncbi:histidinol-phosphate transaminase [Salinispira pacifica]|uniref:Histidinol-phosphate aminotransferase n=1 Tax=Salinispira pacifica TaxID=1307761 RepID=V5WHT1_9SPIO|nr:histidinol-phosphate transaminase [Salinispira pacifica]AHC15089.1 Biosynthetic Aromatic amino acid aminotransferase beta [Salinispira pacifica]
MKWKKDLYQIPPYHPGKKMPGSIKLSSNENPLGPSPKALEAMRGALDSVHIYPPVVSSQLCETVADWRGCAADEIIFGNGSDEVFTMVGATLLGPGRNAVGSENTFSQYEFAARMFGAEYRAAPTRNYQYDLQAMLSLIDSSTSVVFLCSPNNPTGMIIPEPELREFLAAVPKDILVIIDQAYREYAESEKYPETLDLLKEHPNLLITGTFSKIFGLAALRIGYGIARPEVIHMLLRVKSPFNNSSLAQSAAIAAVRDNEFITRSIEFNRNSREYSSKLFSEAGLEFFPSESNFLCVRSPSSDAAGDVRRLQEHGITVRDLHSFGMKEYMRITFSEPARMKQIADILKG